MIYFYFRDTLKFNHKFDSVSVMKGNGRTAIKVLFLEPTIIDNCISFCYILYFWRTGYLPWLDTTNEKDEIVQKNAFCDTELGVVASELCM